MKNPKPKVKGRSWTYENESWRLTPVFRRSRHGGDGWHVTSYHDDQGRRMHALSLSGCIVTFRDVRTASEAVH